MSNTLVEPLKQVLSNTYALYLKTQNYHWNVEGPHFQSLHTLFETQYTDLALAIDTLAELIRGLGHKVPATFEAYNQGSQLKDGNPNASSQDMVKELMQDQTTLQSILQTALTASQHAGDEVVAGFLIERMTAHRKNAWMLRSSLNA